jgi:protein SCO1
MKKKYWKKALPITLALVIFVGVIWVLLQLFNRSELPIIDKAEPFMLEDTQQMQYDSDNRKVKLITFFYTKCPDICPLTMMDFTHIQTQLKNEDLFGSEVELIAITLDPEVDTIERVSEYSKTFKADPSGWKFLRGTPTEIKEIADSYHMKFQKVHGGTIAHNTTMYLVDQNNQIRGLYDMANTQEKVDIEGILESIHTLLEED